MTIKQFIEKAIEGGWKSKDIELVFIEGGLRTGKNTMKSRLLQTYLLDPKAWEAVGKVEGWGGNEKKEITELEATKYHFNMITAIREKMHKMIDALIEGKSIEEYLNNL